VTPEADQPSLVRALDESTDETMRSVAQIMRRNLGD